ncbi:MAG: plasma-membrane proton-efflux P-type ATPase [Burkholderiales bacterium]|nr:plasma-membrane proton-efflux P-type ATPase [Burkholderiales bacterium]
MTGLNGLTSLAAAERLQKFGPNSVTPMRPRGIGALLHKFWGVIPWMLELTIIIELILGKRVEAAVIAALLVFNADIGFLHEGRAQRALALLRQHLTVNARVERDGHWQVVPAAEIVPDDLVRLRVGDIVPADVHLTDGEILVDQSVLTGESLPVEQRAGSTVYSGSLVSRGEATGVVKATGTRTYFGKTAELVRTANAPPRTERLIVRIAQYLGAVVMVLAAAALVAMIIQGTPLSEMLPFGLLLLMSSVPVALPSMFAMSAALGARALADNGILVTRLSAIEDAASMDVLCLDKTGTITENQLTVGKLFPFAPATSDEVLRWAALASDEATQDPIDLAILRAARERGIVATSAQRLSFAPFDPSTKRSEVSVRENGQSLHIVKGEPATVAELAHAPWPEVESEVARLAGDGSRVLAVATGTGLNLRMAGLIALGDPPRTDSAQLIADLRKRGVRILLVTGDGEATARAIAAQVGITGGVAPAGTIREDLDPEVATRFDIFARVFPQDKFLLVQALQKAGHVVGMTGDGVNDAPALKQADIGIAVANATDVAKAAASLVLTKPGLGGVVIAIDGSRRIFQRMQNFVLAMIARKLSTPTFVAMGVIFFGAFVLNPLLMVLLKFAGDFAAMSVSTDQVIPSPQPDRWAVRPLTAAGLGLAALLLALSGAVFWVATNTLQLGIAEAQTLVFVWLVIGAGQAMIYVSRGRGFFWTRPYPGRWLIVATALDIGVVALLATQGWLMAAIPPILVGSMLFLAVAFLLVADLLKVILTRRA